MNDIYKFGPRGHMKIFLSDTAASQMELCPPDTEAVLFIQLLCHAVMQIKNGTNVGACMDRSENNKWILKSVEDVKYYRYEYNKLTDKIIEIPAIDHFTYCCYDLKYEDRLALSLQELSEGYEIVYIDLKICDQFAEALFDAAVEHADRFGRRE